MNICYQTPGTVDPYTEISIESSEDKPVNNIGNGSLLIESDTGDVYLFTKSTSTWTKMFSLKEG